MDRYDKAVEFLTRHPEFIGLAWGDPKLEPGGCLFEFVAADQNCGHYGCLTQIRGGGSEAETDELTLAISLDIRLPCRSIDIDPHHLPIFADWQRRIDSELNRETPCWNPTQSLWAS